MRITRILLLFIVIVINSSSCEKAQLRNLHKKILQTELSKYSDVFDLARTKIEFSGFRYNYFNSSAPLIEIYLFLKPTHDNREELVSIRDEFIEYVNKYWEAKEINRTPYRIAIAFMLDKNEETIPFYILTRYIHYNEWTEWWYMENIGKPYRPAFSSVGDFGTPLIGRTIHNKKLNTLLDKYFEGSYIEHFDGFHSGTDYIIIRLLVTDNCNSETVLAIKDGLIDFFDNNRQELINEYGQYNRIGITFYRLEFYKLKNEERDYYRGFFYLSYRNNEWDTSWR